MPVERGLIGADIGQHDLVSGPRGLGLHVAREERRVGQKLGVGCGLGHTGRLVFAGGHALENVLRDEVALRPKSLHAFQLGIEELEQLRRRSRFVIVADKVDLRGAAIGGPVLPIVDDVVADIERPGVPAGAIEATGEAPIAAGIVGEQIVVKRAHIAADARRVTVLGAGLVVLVARRIQGLGDERILQGDVAG